jgi:hypothetical protein
MQRHFGCSESAEEVNTVAQPQLLTESLGMKFPDWQKHPEKSKFVLMRTKSRYAWGQRQDETHSEHLERLRSHTEEVKSSLHEKVSTQCLSEARFGEYSPFVSCEMRFGKLADLVDQTDELGVIGAASSDELRVRPASCGPNCSGTANYWTIDEQAQDTGVDQIDGSLNFAAGIPVGMMETGYSADPNNNYWTMGYQESNASPVFDFVDKWCSGGTSCAGINSPIAGTGHATAVAGNIGRKDTISGNRRVAADAELFLANGSWSADPNKLTVTFAEEFGSYEYLVEEQVPIVNRSFAPAAGGWSDTRVYLTDWFARYHDLIVTQAAGNLPRGSEHSYCEEGDENSFRNLRDDDDLVAACQARNALCIGSYHGFDPSFGNDQGPVHDGNEDWVSHFSKVGNDGGTDREEPDLLAYGDNSRITPGPGPSSCAPHYTCQGQSSTGTSYAAPDIAGLAALSLSQMEWERCRISEWFRALSQAAAIDHNRFQKWKCSNGELTQTDELTSRYARHDRTFKATIGPNSEDELHGAGVPHGNRMTGWVCPERPEAYRTPDDSEDLDLDRIEELERDDPRTDENEPPSQTGTGFTYTSDANGLHSNAPGAGQATPAGEGAILRRFVFAWSTCPDAGEPDNPSPSPTLATDFNLALTTPAGDQYWMSTSYDDNTEMFEFCAPNNGSYEISVVPRREQGWGCGGHGFGDKGEFMYGVQQTTRVPQSACPELEDWMPL